MQIKLKLLISVKKSTDVAEEWDNYDYLTVLLRSIKSTMHPKAGFCEAEYRVS